MKSIFLKIILIINLFFIYSCKAQTANDYITFYNDVVPKLNSIVPNKTQFYGQNFSNFYNELQNKNIEIIMINCDTKLEESKEYYIIDLYFCDETMLSLASGNSFRYPWVSITFQNEIPNQIADMVKQNHSQWNNSFVQFLSDRKIEKIKFIGVRGYDSTDYSAK